MTVHERNPRSLRFISPLRILVLCPNMRQDGERELNQAQACTDSKEKTVRPIPVPKFSSLNPMLNDNYPLGSTNILTIVTHIARRHIESALGVWMDSELEAGGVPEVIRT
jgi:hypothetical protein